MKRARQRKAMGKPLSLVCTVLVGTVFAALWVRASEQPAVRIEPTKSVGPRVLEKQTETAVVRDYLRAWRSLSGALEQNRADLLDRDFVGTAREKLADTIHEQAQLGIQTRYRDAAHDLQLVFYSPEGLSIQLVDTVDYEVEILDHKKVQTMGHVRGRYLAVLTPTEVQWKVRILQAEPE